MKCKNNYNFLDEKEATGKDVIEYLRKG